MVVERKGRHTVFDSKAFPALNTADGKVEGYAWLAERVNTFINVVRPRVRSAATDYAERLS
ncbi:hypothetical protein [Aliirhizobium smilacinae]|uniref:Uncharacterized protein n=1 Tax=Aliirhizobium smilacinae TaxID=1395944 RepID=A0A5C4XAV2_9HYPH|nr:hypothetical protein [Rhizobium smilacinae]TNM59860.1 hypothetical protein FHP24_27185 [Rhizobium smilacinae]